MSETGYMIAKMPEPQNGEEVKECLRHSREVLRKTFGDLFGRTTYDIALDYIEKLEAAQPKWISVEERLPDVCDQVLVIANGQPKENIELYDAVLIASYWGEEGWIADCFDGWDKLNVTYWKPLPEPPKEEE